MKILVLSNDLSHEEKMSFLIANKGARVRENVAFSILGHCVDHLDLSFSIYLYLLSNMKVEMTRSAARKILHQLLTASYPYYEHNFFGEKELLFFRLCVKYLEHEDMRYLVDEMIKTGEKNFGKWPSDGAYNEILTPIVYMCREAHYLEALEKCADFMIGAGDRYNYQVHMHQIVALYLESGTESSFAKIKKYGEEVSSYDYSDEYRTFCKYCAHLAEEGDLQGIGVGYPRIGFLPYN